MVFYDTSEKILFSCYFLYFSLKDFLRDLWRQISDTGSKLELQSHRFRLKTYTNCFVGHELVDWLLTYGKAANRYCIHRFLFCHFKM